MSTMLRIATAGSVDDGKSTLIGRLLFDSKGVLEDQLASVERTSRDRGSDYVDLSLLTDGLRAEREQGITIDVAYRYFATPRRKFIIADTPGHAQYTRNMVTGASTAHVAVVLVDARKGLLEQSRRHAFLASLLGIKHMVLAVNKMDLVGWEEARFEAIRDDFHAFATRLDVHDIVAIPMSALLGDNVVTRSGNTPWYTGPALLPHLEDVYVAGDRNLVDARLPVQYVIRPHTVTHQDHRSYAGTVAGGIFRRGDEVIVLPSGVSSRIADIEAPGGPVEEAFPPMAVSVTLADDVDLSRGDMIARPGNRPTSSQEIEATVCWMTDRDRLRVGSEYLVKHTTRTTRARVLGLDYRLDVNTLHSDRSAQALELNEIGRIRLRTQVPLLVDAYRRNPATGSFILIDPVTSDTVAAGMVLPQTPADGHPARPATPDTVRWSVLARTEDRPTRGATVWFTGPPEALQSRVAVEVGRRLVEAGRPAYVLDGDGLRRGLNADLGSDPDHRAEGVRRVAHVAALLADAGTVVLISGVGLLAEERETARRIHAEAGPDLHEVAVDIELSVERMVDRVVELVT